MRFPFETKTVTITLSMKNKTLEGRLWPYKEMTIYAPPSLNHVIMGEIDNEVELKRAQRSTEIKKTTIQEKKLEMR